jgi:hypothetical protein
VLKRQVQKLRLEAEEIRLTCQRLEEALVEERADGRRTVDEERMKCASQISELVEKHRNQIAERKFRQH